MNLPTDKPRTHYDVVIVGSGASGGWAAKRLAEAGLKVAIVEAGSPQSDKNFSEHTPRFQLKYREMAPEVLRKTRPIQMKMSGVSEYNYKWCVNDIDEPYTTPKDKSYNWLARTRMVGGRTNIWGRVSLRYSDWDLTAASRDGHGLDWPLSYKDLAPYYDLVERYVGVTGMLEGIEEIPDGQFMPSMPLTCQETMFRNRIKQKLGRTATLSRSANLTQPQNGRGSCHYCGPCERGCMVHAYFNSAFTTVPDAIHSGNCDLITDAMVHQVLMDAETNRARGILYVDRNTRQAHEVYGTVVVLCAQAQESVRILLNSKTSSHPGGLGNSSGVLGHYFTSHAAHAGGSGDFPALDSEPSMGGPIRPVGLYVARFRNTRKSPPSKKFLRGYGYEGGSSVDFNWNAPGYGDAFKKALRQPQSNLEIIGFGEMLPRWDNFVEIDPVEKDIYGIPVLKIQMSNGENEKAMLNDMADSAVEMLDAAGATNIVRRPPPAVPYWAVHEAGIARMGTDPKQSVLNQYQQAHDIKNLFVMDAASFPSNPCQNPTLTIMALCVRSCDYLMNQLKQGTI